MDKQKIEVFIVVNGKLTKQHLRDVTVDLAEEDPTILSIFSNAKPSEYFDMILQLCYRRGIQLNSYADITKEHSDNESGLRNWLSAKARWD